MTTTDLKPGDIVEHPEHGYGVVLKNFPGVPTIYFAGEHGYENTTRRFTGWERVESTPTDDEKPTNATVTLPCPDCGEDITREVHPVRMEYSRTPKWSLEFLRRPGAVGERSHACPPAQPNEPQEFGAKATVAQADGHIERWLNMHAPPQGRRGWLTWDARDTAGSTPGQSKWADWSEIIQRGTVTLGWDE